MTTRIETVESFDGPRQLDALAAEELIHDNKD